MCVKIVADNDSRDDSDAQRFTLLIVIPHIILFFTVTETTSAHFYFDQLLTHTYQDK